jgi:hypothetical protein
VVSGWLDLAFREEGEVKKHVFREKSFFFKMGGDKKYSPQKILFFNGRRHEKKRKKHTHDNFIVLVVRDFSFGGGMVHAYCRSVTIFSSDLQRCVMPSHANNNIARPVI